MTWFLSRLFKRGSDDDVRPLLAPDLTYGAVEEAVLGEGPDTGGVDGARDNTRADIVWHRALGADGPGELRDGDVALAALLLMHGSVMNGGILNAVDDVFSSEEVEAAAAGYRLFGFAAVGDVLLNTREVAKTKRPTLRVLEELEVSSDAVYSAAIPDDDATLFAALEARLDADPEAFAPS